MNSLSQLHKRLDQLTGEKKPSEFYTVQFDHGDGKPPEIVRVWQMRGRDFIRAVSPDEYPGIARDQDISINLIENNQVRV